MQVLAPLHSKKPKTSVNSCPANPSCFSVCCTATPQIYGTHSASRLPSCCPSSWLKCVVRLAALRALAAALGRTVHGKQPEQRITALASTSCHWRAWNWTLRNLQYYAGRKRPILRPKMRQNAVFWRNKALWGNLGNEGGKRIEIELNYLMRKRPILRPRMRRNAQKM